MKPIRTILVDDEPLAIRGLKIRLQEFEDIEIIDTAVNGREAIKKIKHLRPDLLFLDIQMPGLDGFAVVRSLLDTHMPLIVFVTAFDQYAMEAFETHALDYLLKPVEEARLKDAISRAREQIYQRTRIEQAARLLDLVENMEDPPEVLLTAMLEGQEQSPAEQYESQLHIRDRGRIFRVNVSEIDFIDAAGDYMCIHVGEETHILRETMKVMEQRLDPKLFKRVHRSTIVNLDRVKEVVPHSNGECFLILSNRAEVKVSRSYKEVVGRFI